MASFSVMLDEAQRLLLVRALANLPLHHAPDPAELRLLQQMLEDLPAAEAASPGVLHGLCL